VHSVFAEASEVLGYDLWALVSQGPEERLNATQFTQPAMLAAGVAAWRVWCEQTDVRPGWLAGHSLGEYTALVCANSIDFQDAIRLVAERARLMQEAVPAEVGADGGDIGPGGCKGRGSLRAGPGNKSSPPPISTPQDRSS
jgi:[acyl-carrier-protein] S-malonyltransferase